VATPLGVAHVLKGPRDVQVVITDLFRPEPSELYHCSRCEVVFSSDDAAYDMVNEGPVWRCPKCGADDKVRPTKMA
jgi:DNA-directed RNA polymerase subunit RPC12/RpoP